MPTNTPARWPDVPIRYSLLLAAAILLPSTASAQGFDPRGTSWEVDQLLPITRTLPAELVGNGVPDVVALENGELTLFSSPSLFAGHHPMGLTANDFDVIPKFINEQDGIAYVDGTGLNNAWVDLDSPSHYITVHMEGELWRHASKVRAGHLNAGTSLDYVGVASDPKTLILRLDDTLTTILLANNEPIRHLELIDWDGDGHSEIAFVDASGLSIYSASGSQILRIPSYGVGLLPDLLIHLDNWPTEQLVWISQDATGTSQLLVLVDATEQIEVTNLDWIIVQSGSSGNLDTDKHADLVFGHHFSNDPVIFFNQSDNSSAPTTFTMDPAHQLVLDSNMNVSPPTNDASPTVADFDGDDNIDIYYPIPGECGSVLFLGEMGGDANVDSYITYAIQDGTNLHLDLSFPTPPALTPTHMEITLYYRANYQDPQSYVETDPYETLYHPWGETTSALLPYGPTVNPYEAHYFLMRPVRELGSVRIEVAPASAGVFVPDRQESEVTAYIEASGPWIDVDLFDSGGQGGGIFPIPNINPLNRTTGPGNTGNGIIPGSD